MTRRGSSGEVGFGSDSFLDIIANIVGILIILIVIAGLRVSHAPVTKPRADSPAVAIRAELPPPVPVEPAETLPASAVSDRASEPPTPAAAAEPVAAAPAEPIEEFEQRASELQIELARLDSERSRQHTEWETLNRRKQDLLARREQLSGRLANQTEVLRTLESGHDQRRQILDQERSRAQQIVDELQQATQTGHGKKLEHRVTPISQTVTGKELHFRLAQNRVAYVPINELVDRLRPQFERQKHWLLKYRSHEGQIGPVDGFRLNYRMERQRLSALEELRQGSGMVRISLTEWHVVPEPDLPTEGIADVFRPGSAFLQVIGGAHPASTLTFWVYPDSFKLYRQLEQFAHDEGFQVAARPLPFGLPIAGSPHGSRSAGQ